ncbi:hypothetical protein CALVIDRAFT_564349, partial [Calocera viscosa TUFC12733]
MAECEARVTKPMLAVGSGNSTTDEGSIGLGAAPTPSRRASPEQANDVVARGMQKNVGFGRYNYTTHFGLRLWKTPVADTATTPSTELAAHAGTVDTPLRLRESALCLRESPIAVTAITTDSDSASSAVSESSSSPPSNPSNDTSDSGNTAAAVPECAVVAVAASGRALASSREQELINCHTDTIPASPPPSYIPLLGTSSADFSRTEISSTTSTDSSSTNSSSTNSSSTNSSSTNSSSTNSFLEDDRIPATPELLPTYKRWEDIPPIYATLRVPKLPQASHSHSPSPPASPAPKYTHSLRGDPPLPTPSLSSTLPPSPPPSPTPRQVSNRTPFSARYILDDDVMEAAARVEARKLLDKEKEMAKAPTPSRVSNRAPFSARYILDDDVMEAAARVEARKLLDKEKEMAKAPTPRQVSNRAPFSARYILDDDVMEAAARVEARKLLDKEKEMAKAPTPRRVSNRAPFSARYVLDDDVMEAAAR